MKKLSRYIAKLFLNDAFILTIVILNSIVIFAQCYYNATDTSFRLLTHLDSFFTVLFVIEVTVKIKALSFKKYWADRWNRIDYVVTIVTAVSLVQYITPNQFTQAIGVVSAIRTFRVLKLVKLMRFIPNIKSLVNSLKLAVKTTSVIMLAFLIIIFIISIVTCTIFRNSAPEYFANPFDSLYNTFRIFTVEGWYEIPNAIVGNGDVWITKLLVRLYFSFILFFGGIIGMGLITSMLVDAMAADNNDEVLEHIKSLEEKIDELNKKLEEKKEFK